ncbi:MAG TPA: TIGR03557 family F420-dependent LLM class oxidoreductase, partial [Actinomycetaceae bacterium]|nr:TIGR03557 family F420-dependent LLM class oxidoreductase [Actinomycetaceae bacterium]
MATYGFHASHEQIAPSQLLRDLQRAESADFELAMCSDHFAPWSVHQGQSGFAWSWLGAALATTSLPMGTVTAPGQRYHPAVVAQASATLAEMFPGRFWLALGTGQNMNEHITGDKWPDKAQRQARLEESVELIRRLHTGAEVTYRGSYVTAERARIYSLPAQPPALIGPALSPPTAARAAAWADGLITINSEPAEMREIVAAYRDNGGTGPLALQVHISIAPTLAEARDIARDQWRNHPFAEPIPHDTAT